MAKTNIYKLIIDRDSFVVLAADADFYAYVNENDIYSSFDRLICREDLPLFLEHAKSGKGCFLLRVNIAEGGKSMHCFAAMEAEEGEDGKSLLHITLVNVFGLIDSERTLQNKFTMDNKILELYGDDLFIYYSDICMMRIMSNYNIELKDTYLSLDELEQILKRKAAKDRYEDIKDFVLDIKNCKRYFDICLEGDVFGDDKTVKYTVIKGAVAYENDDRIVLGGYIHKESKGISHNDRKIEFDSLTGVLSKGTVTDIVVRTIDIDKRKNISIAIVDVDYFKKVNDTYGHMMGDKILKKIAAILKDEVGNDGVVGRIGGDEFFVMFYDVYDLETARGMVRGMKNAVMNEFPAGNKDKPTVTLSIGCAAYPKDAESYAELFELADFALYMAKEKGRNRYVIYDKEKHGIPAKMHAAENAATRINSRGDMSPGDVMCAIMDKMYLDNAYPVDKLLDDFLENLNPQRIIVYDAQKAVALYAVGAKIPDKAVFEETQKYIMKDVWQKRYADDIVLINNVVSIEAKDKEVYDMMVRQKILSCVRVSFKDKNGHRCILSIESVNQRITWSDEHMKYYRLMARLLSGYELVRVE